MRRDILELDTSLDRSFAETRLTLHDVESIRLLLSGGSIVDWHRAAFTHRDAVADFLALHLLDLEDPDDLERVRFVYAEAVAYLEEHLHLRFPPELRNPPDVAMPFVVAAHAEGFRRRQVQACVVLKLMHVIHHMEAADLKFKTPVSEEELFDRAEARIMRAARQMREDGIPLVYFNASRKARSSVITKLLVKKETIAATIFDKLRFRFIVERPDDLVPALAWMTRRLVPFNHLIPGESHNNLLDPELVVAALDKAESPQDLLEMPSRLLTGKNEFSASGYKMINFIVDFPVRLPDEGGPFSCELGRVVYVMIEFQLLDEQTARENEDGDNAHHLYKKRQRARVAARLKRGRFAREAAVDGE